MDLENNRKKIIIPTLIAVVMLMVLVVGATYAYFKIVASNNYATSKVTTSIGDVGSVAIKSSQNDLILDLSATDMLQKGEDVIYYASATGATTTETKEIMGTISVSGEGTFDCTYSMDIVATSKSDETNMYKKFQNMNTKSEGQIVLTIDTQNGTKTYDFATADLFTEENSFKQVFNGTVSGLKDGSPENIEAQLKLVNKTGVNQDDLKGTDITLSISISSFNCEIVG